MSSSPELETKVDKTKEGLRRTERIMLEIPIRVFSYAGSAGGFSEDTRTLMVNRDGALILIKHHVLPEETIRIINLENLREDDFRVVGLARQVNDGAAEWGVEGLDKNRSLWEIDFPPPMEISEPNAGALLQCRGCGKQSFMVLSLTEVSNLDLSGALEKLCENCGDLTAWEYTEEIRLPKNPAPPIGVPSAPQETASPAAKAVEIAETSLPVEAPSAPPPKWDQKSERRKFKRLTLKLPILVRNNKGETELERTENISKGGLGVGLTMQFAVGELVTLICPYSGAGLQIEQKAEVRRRASLYGGQKWFYGFRYISG
jgi:PilZ domain